MPLLTVVVPRVGGRGLKSFGAFKKVLKTGRPPRRGTWIEIPLLCIRKLCCVVVPRVGGRGLKSRKPSKIVSKTQSSPA